MCGSTSCSLSCDSYLLFLPTKTELTISCTNMKSGFTFSILLVLSLLSKESAQDDASQNIPTSSFSHLLHRRDVQPKEGSCAGHNPNSNYMPALVCTHPKTQKTPFVRIEKKDCLKSVPLVDGLTLSGYLS